MAPLSIDLALVPDPAIQVLPLLLIISKNTLTSPLFSPLGSAVQVAPSSVLRDAYPSLATAIQVFPFESIELKIAEVLPLFSPLGSAVNVTPSSVER